MHCNLRSPKPRQPFPALITTPCQVWSRWTYPLPYYSIFAADTLLYARIGVLETLESWSRDVSRPVFTSLGLGLGTLESRSRAWSWNLRVLFLVLEPSSLCLGLDLGTSESCSWSWDTGQCCVQSTKKSSVCLPPLLLWNGYLATVVCWCGQTGLEWVTTCYHSWSTCDTTVSCKFSCCCTVVISL